MPIGRFYEYRPYVEHLSKPMRRFLKNDTNPCASLSIFSLYPFDDLWFIDWTEFLWRVIGFNVRSSIKEGSRLVVPSQCLDVFFIPPSSHPEILLAPSITENDNCESARWLPVSNLLVLTYLSSLVFIGGAAEGLGFVSLESKLQP